MNREALLLRARDKGVNPLVYWPVRAVMQLFFHLYFRLGRVGREHIPQEGAVIFAANHRSFLDPFVIGTMVRRPIYYLAKKELFRQRLTGWFLNSLGAFPIERGASDGDAMAVARAILERGDCVLIFPEGTRIRPGGLAEPRRGVGRLALETGAPVVPLAVIGTEAVRRGWRIRPHKVRICAGRPLTFPKLDAPSPELAGAVTDRIWPCVMLQWEWLGGLPPLRGKVFADVDAYARRRGGGAGTFAGLAGAGDLAATVLATQSRNRRAGELLGRGVPAGEIEPQLRQVAEALDALGLLATALRAEGVRAPAVDGLAAVVTGESRTPRPGRMPSPHPAAAARR